MKIYYMGERIDTYKRDKIGRFARVVEPAQRSRWFGYVITFMAGVYIGMTVVAYLAAVKLG